MVNRIIELENTILQFQAELEQMTADRDAHSKIRQRHLIRCGKACERLEQLQVELTKLKEFARHIIEIECWSIFDQDGGDIQDLAEKLGLIEQHIATEDDINEDISDFEVGDTIYKFSKVLKGE